MWSHIFEEKNLNCAHNVLWKKKVVLKANFNQLLKKLFFQSTFRAQLIKTFKNLRPKFQNSFVPTFFLMFSVLGSSMEHKKGIENRTAVYFCLHHEFYKMLSIFGHFCCFAVWFLIFLLCFSGIQKYAWKDVLHTVILAI